VWRADTGTVGVPTGVDSGELSEIHAETNQVEGSPRRFDGVIVDHLVHRDDPGLHQAPWHVRVRLGEDV
jgi:hypothetical protein